MTNSLLNSQTNVTMIEKKQRRLKNLSTNENPSTSHAELNNFQSNYQSANNLGKVQLSITQSGSVQNKISNQPSVEKLHDNYHKYTNKSIDSQTKLNPETNIDFEQFRSHLETMKDQYEKKLTEIDGLNNDILLKEKKISEYTQYLKKYMDQNKIKYDENPHDVFNNKATNYNQNSNLNSLINEPNFQGEIRMNLSKGNNLSQEEEKNMKLKEINNLKHELNNLKRKHEKQKIELENQLNNELEISLEKLKFEYEEKIKNFTEENEKTIKHLQDEIYILKVKLEDFDKKYITKAEHEKIFNQIKDEQNKELEMYEKEVEKLEQLLRENNLMFNNNTNSNVVITNPNNPINLFDMQKELQNGNENGDVVCVISELGSLANNNAIANSITKNYSNSNIKTTNKNENVI